MDDKNKKVNKFKFVDSSDDVSLSDNQFNKKNEDLTKDNEINNDNNYVKSENNSYFNYYFIYRSILCIICSISF